MRMPEQIRVKVGSVNTASFSVYDEFARNIPGFLPIPERDIELLTPKAVSFKAEKKMEIENHRILLDCCIVSPVY